jgi:hypothetical protein
MQKLNKTMMRIISALLCLVLLSTSILSGIFAKYVVQKSADFGSIAFKKWGITVTANSNLAAEYKKSDNSVAISATTANEKVFAPGTTGNIAYFYVKSTAPEVDYKIDFNGTAKIGNGYTTIRDSEGKKVEYFPIIFYLVAYDINSNGEIIESSIPKNADEMKMDFTIGDRNKISDTEYVGIVNLNTGNQIYSFENFANIQGWLNGEDDYDYEAGYTGGLNTIFDSSTIGNGKAMKRVYAIQWCWPYDSKSDYRKKNISNSTVKYQNSEYDGQIGAAMLKNPEDFEITFDVELRVEQVST